MKRRDKSKTKTKKCVKIQFKDIKEYWFSKAKTLFLPNCDWTAFPFSWSSDLDGAVTLASSKITQNINRK